MRRKPKPSAQPEALHSQALRWLIALSVATMLPHLARLPWPLVATTLALLLWRATLLWQGRAAPRSTLTSLLALGCAGLIWLIHGRFFGRDPGMDLLMCLVCLKLFECQGRRDGLLLVFLNWFLQLGLFFYSQTPLSALAVLLSVLMGVAALNAVADRPRPGFFTLGLALRQSLRALPFALILFLFFPRVSGPLWGLPADAYSASTGISDHMSPGSIAKLILSDGLAFRARFDGAPPPRAQRYWRGPVLSRFDGKTWSQGTAWSLRQAPYEIPAQTGPIYRYTLSLEPHNQHWLFALEQPLSAPPGTTWSNDWRLLSLEPLRQRSEFILSAAPQLRGDDQEFRAIMSEARRLPQDGNPRARALASQWRQEFAEPHRRFLQALDFYRQGGFRYTLEPPLAGPHGIDEFLFDHRLGFCEHFAGSFVFLMRAAGLPARVVTGYQGGEINPFDGFLTVRQSDAHAWAEVWLPGEGWLRVDPTAIAAPQRVDGGLGAALPQSASLPFGLRPEMNWLKDLRWRWEALANGWNRWVVGFNPERQRQLLNSLGIVKADYLRLVTIMGASLALLILFCLLVQPRRSAAKDPALAAWQRACRKLAAVGLVRHPWEGPQAYCQRLCAARPDLAPALHEVCHLYTRCRYGNEPDKLKDLQKAIARLRPKRSALPT